MANIVNADPKRYTQTLIKKALIYAETGQAKKLQHHKRCKDFDLYKIDIGYRHRLVSSDRVNWELLSHSEYNLLFKRKIRG